MALVQHALNSFTYAGAAACIAIALSLAIACINSRRLLPGTNVLSFLWLAPFVVPGIVLAIAFYAAYAPLPLSLYGTATHCPRPGRGRQRRQFLGAARKYYCKSRWRGATELVHPGPFGGTCLPH